MGFENGNLDRLNRSILVEKVLNIIRTYQKEKSFRILESDFVDVEYKTKNETKKYSKEEIFSDMQEVKRLKEIFKSQETKESKESKEYADALEFIVNERIELDNWLGDSAYTYTTSVYDDYKNGVDSIIEFIDEEDFDFTHMGLAFDFTYSSDVFKKFERIKSNLDSGKLSEIKYFSSDNSDYKGPIHEVPRLVIGASKKTIDELMELFLDTKKINKSKNDISVSKKLEKHYFQINVLKQIIYQLKIFKNYSLKIDNEVLSKKLDYFLNKISKILRDKQEGGKIEDKSNEDEFLMRIESCCNAIFK